MGELGANDPRATPANPILCEIDQPGVGPLLTPGLPLDLGEGREPPAPAPVLGQHTEEILDGVLGMAAARSPI